MDELEVQIGAQTKLEEIQRLREESAKRREINSAESVSALRKAFETKGNKADLKKSTAFVKRLKAVTREGLAQCIRDVGSLKLNKYLEEIVDGLVETKYKAAEVQVSFSYARHYIVHMKV